jgi:FMN phosphatase YigB (HAD superfamily)
MTEDVVVFFDIGDTLAGAVADPGGAVRLDVFPFVPEVLSRLRGAGGMHGSPRLGLMSNTGDLTGAAMNALLADAGLLPLFEADLCLFSSVEGIDKSQPAFFTRGSDRADLPAARCLFVGENERERRVAESAGFRTSPHPLHALHLVETELAPPAPG